LSRGGGIGTGARATMRLFELQRMIADKITLLPYGTCIFNPTSSQLIRHLPAAAAMDGGR
jgi:hypothetical protein